MPPLKNTKHELFCQALISGKTQAAAAIEAGYKPSRVRQTSSFLVTTRNISARLEELKQMAASALIMGVTERKERLSEIARARISNFVTCNNGVSRISVGLDSVNSAALQEVVSEEAQIGKGENAPIAVITKLKLRDPVAAIAELNKMGGDYAPTRTEITGKDGKPIQVETKPDLSSLTDEELDKLENILSKTTKIDGG